MPRDVYTGDRIAPPVGAFSPAVRAGELVYLSGQVAQDPSTGKLAWPASRSARPSRSTSSRAEGRVMDHKLILVDVFADQPFSGNQLAVFPDARGLSDRAMQALAREINFAETRSCCRPGSTAP
jgi:hypothetical protein